MLLDRPNCNTRPSGSKTPGPISSPAPMPASSETGTAPESIRRSSSRGVEPLGVLRIAIYVVAKNAAVGE